jgi:predicted PurR-regulated permease PerM
MHKHVSQKYVPTAVFAVVLFLVGMLLFPYYLAILSAIVLAVIFYPLYKKLTTKISPRNSALTTCLVVLVSIFLPLFFIIQSLVSEVTKLLRGGLLDTLLSHIENPIVQLFDINFDLTFLVDKALLYTQNVLQNMITSLPEAFIFVFIAVFLCYYFLIDGSKILSYFFELFAISKKHKAKIVERFNLVAYGVVYGQVLIAIAQGIAATIGFMILGIPSPVLLGLLITFVAFIPAIGSSIVWGPLALYYVFTQQYVIAILIVAYGIIIIGYIDNILRAKLIGDQTKMHPAIVLLSVMGGLHTFGFIGIFIGPLIVVVCQQLLVIYSERKHIV